MDTVVKRLEDAYAALGRGDEQAALAMLAPDCQWQESAELPGVDALHGREAVAAFLRDFLEPWERFEQKIEDVVVEGDRIGLSIHLTAVGRASGLELDTHYAHLWTIRDGLGVRVDAYRDPEAMRAELFGDARRVPASPRASDASQNTA